MDAESTKQFEALLREEPGSLRETDLAFLRARASYLTTEQRERFASVLALPEEKPEPKPEKKSK